MKKRLLFPLVIALVFAAVLTFESTIFGHLFEYRPLARISASEEMQPRIVIMSVENTTVRISDAEQEIIPQTPPAPHESESNAEKERRCIKAYRETVDDKETVEYKPGKTVMMDPKSIALMCRVLSAKSKPDVLEWGCGGSTAFFSQFAGSWHSVEHDRDWGEQFRVDLSSMLLLAPEGSVTLDVVEPDIEWAPGGATEEARDGTAEQFATYCNAPRDRHATSKYDVILIDGRARVHCAVAVIRDKLLRDDNSIVLIHDIERKWLQSVFGTWYEPIEWDRTETRQLASMRPLPPKKMAKLPARLPSAVSEVDCFNMYQQAQASLELKVGKRGIMGPVSVQVICRVMTARRSPDVLEWGSGALTAFFSRFAGSWHSIDHDGPWVEQFRQELARMSLLAPEGKVTLDTVDPDIPWTGAGATEDERDGTSEQFASYCNAPTRLFPREKYDVVLIDGRARVPCAAAVLRDGLLRDERSVVLMHDFEREWLQSVLRWYSAVEWERSESRQLVVLQSLPDSKELRASLPPRQEPQPSI